MQVIQDLERRLVTLLRLLDCFCFGDACFWSVKSPFPAATASDAAFELFSLYKFAEESRKHSRPFPKSPEYQKP
jgi:hypothetical protein